MDISTAELESQNTEAALAKSKKDMNSLINIPPQRITMNKALNTRRMEGEKFEKRIAGLMESILVNGLLNPVYVKRIHGEDDLYELDHGYCRFEAITRLIEAGHPFEFVRALLVPKNSNDEDSLLRHITLNDGEPLDLLEEADTFNRLKNLGWTQKKIAERIGVPEIYVSNCLRVLGTPTYIQNALTSGVISKTTILEVIRKNSEGKNGSVDWRKVNAALNPAIQIAKASGKKVTKANLETEGLVKINYTKAEKNLRSLVDSMKERQFDQWQIDKAEKILAVFYHEGDELLQKILEIN